MVRGGGKVRDSLGFHLFASFYWLFFVLTLVAMAQSQPLAAGGFACLTFSAGEAMNKCRS